MEDKTKLENLKKKNFVWRWHDDDEVKVISTYHLDRII